MVDKREVALLCGRGCAIVTFDLVLFKLKVVGYYCLLFLWAFVDVASKLIGF
jgi:hypothetical protein